MSYTAVLWILIVLITGLAIAFSVYVLPILKRLDNNLNVVANNDNLIGQHLSLILSETLATRNNTTDIKQSLESLNGLNKEAIRNLPKKDELV